MGGKAGKQGVKTTREKQMKEAQTKADWLLPFLKREKGWDFAIGDRQPTTKEEMRLKRRAVTRITKKAVALIYPNHKCSVRHGMGTAHHWVRVGIEQPSPNSPDPGARRKTSERVLCQKVKDTLVALHISYATFLPDSLPEEDQHELCLSLSL